MTIRERIVIRSGLPYLSTARILGLSEGDILDLITEDNHILNEIEKDYRATEWPEVQEALAEMKQDIPEGPELRRAWIEQEIEMTRKEFFEECKDYAKEAYLPFEGRFQRERIEALERKLWSLGMEAKIHVGKAEAITPEQIAHARQFPLSSFLTARNGMTRCPFHDDKVASMDIRKNFYHCYGCGEQGDVIDFVMKTQGLSFKEAITKLT